MGASRWHSYPRVVGKLAAVTPAGIELRGAWARDADRIRLERRLSQVLRWRASQWADDDAGLQVELTSEGLRRLHVEVPGEADGTMNVKQLLTAVAD